MLAPEPKTRTQMLQEQLDAVCVCNACGSTYFYEVVASEYSAGRYSSGTGGEISPKSNIPQTILVCLCGTPRTPNLSGTRGGRTATQEMSRFMESLKKSQEYLRTVEQGQGSVTTAVSQVVNAFATREDLDGLATQLKAIAQAHKELAEAVAAKPRVGRPPKAQAEAGE